MIFTRGDIILTTFCNSIEPPYAKSLKAFVETICHYSRLSHEDPGICAPKFEGIFYCHCNISFYFVINLNSS